MADIANTDSELHAKWVAAQDIDRFHVLLNAETEEGKYEVLAQLLSREPSGQCGSRFHSYAPPVGNIVATYFESSTSESGRR